MGLRGVLFLGVCLLTIRAWAIEMPVFNSDGKSASELATASSLQGILAKSQTPFYIAGKDSSSNPGPKFWLEQYLKEHPEITVSWKESLAEVIEANREKLNGYILYGPNEKHINEATSLSGIKRALIANEAMEPTLKSLGLPLVADVRDKSEKWVWDHFHSEFSKNEMASLNPEIQSCLRDYLILKNAFVFYENPAVDTFLAEQIPHTFLLGWGPSELNFFHAASVHNLQGLATDFLQGAASLSQWHTNLPPQSTHVKETELLTETDVHYVAFVMSDGDNPQWLTNAFVFDKKWWGSPHRGKFTMNWDLSPGLIDLSPITLKYLHENATRGATKDFFVTAHGAGTDYPSEVPRLGDALTRSYEYMRQADQNVLSILDNRWDPKTIETILEQPGIVGAMFKSNWGCGYRCLAGKIYWHRGKPMMSATYSLWDNEDSPESLVASLNRAPRRPLSDERSFSIVNVHPWSTGGLGDPMSNVNYVVERLHRKVRVVTLEELFLRLAKTHP